MNEELQRAITAGVVVQAQGGHRCRVCNKDVTEIGPHLRGKDHFNNLAWEAISNPAPHPFLLDALPPVVREAKKRSELEPGEKIRFSYRCLVCPKRPVSDGIRSLEAHLKGKDHEKAKTQQPNAPLRPAVVPLKAKGYDSELQRALTEGVVAEVTRAGGPPSFKCCACDKDFTGSAPCLEHLRSDKHKKKELQRAISAGVVVPTQGGYKCRVCDKDLTEILPHLRGKDHQNNLVWEALSNPVPHPFLLDALPPALRDAKQRGELEPADKIHFSYSCLVCRTMVDSDGMLSLEAHLKGKDHKKSKRALSFYISEAVPMGKIVRLPSPCQQPQALPLVAKRYHSELQRALTAGVVAEVPGVGGPPSFKCHACSKDFSGSAPCLEHLRSNRHKKKTESWTPQPAPDIEGQGSEDGWERSPIDELPIAGRRKDQADSTFRWQVMTATDPIHPDDFVYRNLSMPRGLVLIFNYYFTGQEKQERRGAKRDSCNLKTLFEHMGYSVDLHEDCSKSQTEEVLTITQNNPKLRDLDSFIVFIMSHGKDDQIFYTASGRDEDCMKLDDVRYRFTDTECPALSGKPKLFFVNICRATREQVAYDSMAPPRPQPEDMVTVYSCINSFMSLRDPLEGTLFVQAWCEVLAAHAHNEDLQYLQHRTHKRLKEMGGSVQELQSYAFKVFYFNPRHEEEQPWSLQQQTQTLQPLPALPIGGGTLDPVDGSREFRWAVLTGTRPFPPSDMVYRNLSLPRGLVLIFNYCFTGQRDERRGAKQDSFNLQTLFHRMGYCVYLYEDYSKPRTEEVLTSIQANPRLKDYDSFIVFILSHGNDDQTFCTTSFNEEDRMKLDDVRYKFTDTACPSLSGKPKLFFVNIRRATAEVHHVFQRMAPHNPGPKNIMTLYSGLLLRDPEYGTFFVQAWCEVLAAHAHNEELRDLHLRVCQRLEDMKGSVPMENMKGSLPELEGYFFKRFYFNPVNTHQ